MNNKEVFEQLKTLSSDMEGKLSQLLSLNNFTDCLYLLFSMNK